MTCNLAIGGCQIVEDERKSKLGWQVAGTQGKTGGIAEGCDKRNSFASWLLQVFPKPAPHTPPGRPHFAETLRCKSRTASSAWSASGSRISRFDFKVVVEAEKGGLEACEVYHSMQVFGVKIGITVQLFQAPMHFP